jgi:isoquinoline 1-oxidoreductase alpha subunit
MDLTVNGTSRTVDAPPDMPLLWALRDLLGLTGTKFGCGEGHCGACTVQIDGTPVRSCSFPTSAAVGKAITTIEGLAANGVDHPVQQAWEQLNVPQCGYCQAGQLMSAAALIDRTPAPTDRDIDAAMAGNLCRCGTYVRIRQAVKLAGQIKSGGANS